MKTTRERDDFHRPRPEELELVSRLQAFLDRPKDGDAYFCPSCLRPCRTDEADCGCQAPLLPFDKVEDLVRDRVRSLAKAWFVPVLVDADSLLFDAALEQLEKEGVTIGGDARITQDFLEASAGLDYLCARGLVFCQTLWVRASLLPAFARIHADLTGEIEAFDPNTLASFLLRALGQAA